MQQLSIVLDFILRYIQICLGQLSKCFRLKNHMSCISSLRHLSNHIYSVSYTVISIFNIYNFRCIIDNTSLLRITKQESLTKRAILFSGILGICIYQVAYISYFTYLKSSIYVYELIQQNMNVFTCANRRQED